MDARPAGPLGPRLPGRLTAELISRSPQYMSCIKLYEIDLRGNKIGAIENLGVTENQFDSIDLSDNAIVRLEGFPRLPRLRMLLLSNNRIAKIARNLEGAIKNLEVLVLTNNKITELKDIDPLSSLPKLYSLSLVGNPVALKKEYRLYTISRCPHLKHLDFKKVKQKEREQALKLYGTLEQQQQAAAGNTFEPGEGLPESAAAAAMDTDNEAAAGAATVGEEGAEAAANGGDAAASAATAAAAAPTAAPTAEQLTAIKAAVANAQTLEDAWRLEQALKAGGAAALAAAEELQRQQQADGAAAMDEG